MEGLIRVYKNVFSREDFKDYEFNDFITSPMKILSDFNVTEEVLLEIRNTPVKEDRNDLKRKTLPAIDFSQCELLTIDIDAISDDAAIKEQCINRLSKLDTCLLIQETASGNLVAFFRYKCRADDFKFVYYKLYLELTLLLSVSIDFLPEIGRLRYLNAGLNYYYNPDSKVITEMLRVKELPYINTQVKKPGARSVIYGSR
jgi:hypothetical protein